MTVQRHKQQRVRLQCYPVDFNLASTVHEDKTGPAGCARAGGPLPFAQTAEPCPSERNRSTEEYTGTERS